MNEGFRDDIDQFARWTSQIASSGLGQLYTDNPGGPVTFGPVMLWFPERPLRKTWIALAIVFSLNLVAAIPPDSAFASLVPTSGVFGIVGAFVLVGLAIKITVHTQRAGVDTVRVRTHA